MKREGTSEGRLFPLSEQMQPVLYLREVLFMTIERIVVAFAGAAVLISVLLSVFHSLNWLWFTGFVGANLLQSAFTGFCPLAKILSALGFKPGPAFKRENKDFNRTSLAAEEE